MESKYDVKEIAFVFEMILKLSVWFNLDIFPFLAVKEKNWV